MPDLNALVIFATVVESKSFSEAARRLRMPLSTVSRRVAELECELGVQLLERSTRKLRLTAVGIDVYKHAHTGVELNEAVRDIVDDHNSLMTGRIRIDAPPSVSDSLLAPIIGAFQDKYPRVHTQVFVRARLTDLMSDGMDVGFVVTRSNDPSLVSRTILKYRHQIVASPKYLEEHGEPRIPEDLLKHRLLAFPFWRSESTWHFVRKDGTEKRSISFNPYISMNDYAGMLPRIVAGAGIGEIPPIVLPNHVRDGTLVEVLPDWKWEPFDLNVVYLSSRYVTRAMRAFINIAEDLAPRLFPDLPT